MLKKVIDKQNKKLKKLTADTKELKEEYEMKLESFQNKVNKYRKKYVTLKMDTDETIYDQEGEIQALKEEQEIEVLKLKGRIYTLETVVEENVDSGHEVFDEEFTPIEAEWNRVLEQNKTLKEKLAITKGTVHSMKRKLDDMSEDFLIVKNEKNEYKDKYFNLKTDMDNEKDHKKQGNGNKKREDGANEEDNDETVSTSKKMEQSTLTQTPGLIYKGNIITPGNKKKE